MRAQDAGFAPELTIAIPDVMTPKVKAPLAEGAPAGLASPRVTSSVLPDRLASPFAGCGPLKILIRPPASAARMSSIMAFRRAVTYLRLGMGAPQAVG